MPLIASSALHQHLLIFIFILLSIFNVAASCNTTTATIISNNSTQTTSYQNKIRSNYITYIKIACNSTTYPSTCYHSLYSYATKIKSNPLKLCNTSLSLALKAAYRASATISKVLKSNEYLAGTGEQIVKDCLYNLRESIGELRESLNAMEHMDDMDKDFQKSNIKTWVSAAITEDQTCSDGFDGENMDATVREKIRKNILKVARMTSNALYFINNLTY